jgi:hypothetical protein
MKKLLFSIGLISVICLSGYVSLAQVSINEDGAPPENCAILDVDSPDKGILIPRVNLVSESSSEPVIDPVVGLMVFNVGGALPQGIYYWRGSGWNEFITSEDPFPGANYAEIFEATETGTTLTLSNADYLGWTTAEQGVIGGDVSVDVTNETASRITINSAGDYEVIVSCSFGGDNNQTIEGAIFKNDSRILKLSFFQTLTSNSEKSAGSSGIMNLQEGDYLDLRFKSTSNNRDLNLKIVNLRVVKIGNSAE